MTGHLDFNPHETPPQVLKDVFKSWKGQLTPERDRHLNENVVNMPRLDRIPHHRLAEIFDRFSEHDVANKPDITEQVALDSSISVYSSQHIPGLLILPSLLPPTTQKTLLSHLLHRDLSTPSHKTNLHLHYDVNYPDRQASFFSIDPSTITFQPKDPVIHSPLTVKAALEKKLRWTTLGGQYDWTNKVYPAEAPPKFPSDIAGLLRGLFSDMEPEAAIVNLYSPGDTLSLHRDVSEEVDRGLVSVSLGCDAIFIIGLQDKTSGAIQYEVLRLTSGDAVFMSGQSRFAWHGVPKIIPGTCPDYLSHWPGKEFPEWKNWMSNKRINLNVRQMREPDLEFDTLGKPRTMANWKELGEAKRDSVNALIPKAWLLPAPLPPPTEQRDVTGKYIQQFLTPREIEITETDAVGIIKNTTTATWKAREVAEAFCHRAALAHQMVHCLHEIFFEAAINDAELLDEYYAQHGKPLGPLHGLPISLKDQFHVRGVETTMGYVGWIGTFEGKKGTGKEKVYESEMVTELRNLGAILFCKTSVPHTLMAGETINNIIGYTWNPKNRHLAAGGSSGGEGALIGLKASPVGFGTDIGGSIRIPAAFNGLYGIRPSSGRLPYEGMANSMDGQNSILSVVGPLATSVGALKLVIKSLLSQQPWLHDPLVAEIPWRDEKEQEVLDIVKAGSGGQLVFAIMHDDGFVRPQPPVRRALDVVVKTIEKLGHKVVDWNPPAHARCNELVDKIWGFDGGEDVYAALGLAGEPMCTPVAAFYGIKKEQYTASQISAINVLKRQYQKEYMEYWNGTASHTGTGRPVDAIISPLAPFAAARPDMAQFGTGEQKTKRVLPGLSAWVNLLDYSTAVLPVMLVDRNIDVVDVGYTPKNPTDEKIHRSYDPELYDGAHVSVQVIGRRFQEEKVLTITEILGDALGKHVV